MNILKPMSESRFAEYLTQAIPDFAKAKVASGQWHESEAMDLSRQSFEKSLPQGVATPDNFVYDIHNESGTQVVGHLWIALQSRGEQKIAYVFDVAIHSDHQRQGHATRAFNALEIEVRRLGLSGIGLHVFGYNTSAHALYVKLGYLPTNIHMFKAIA